MQIPNGSALPESPAMFVCSSRPWCCKCCRPCSQMAGYMRLLSSSHGLKYLILSWVGVRIPKVMSRLLLVESLEVIGG
eukprot:9033381-Heterocapsa_arctica.AAC.1